MTQKPVEQFIELCRAVVQGEAMLMQLFNPEMAAGVICRHDEQTGLAHPLAVLLPPPNEPLQLQPQSAPRFDPRRN